MTTTKRTKLEERAVDQAVAYRLAGGWRVEMAGVVAANAPRLSDALRSAANKLDGIEGADAAPSAASATSTRLLTSKDVAEWLGTSVRVAQQLLGSGAINSIRVGEKALRCEAADVERYIAGQRAKGLAR